HRSGDAALAGADPQGGCRPDRAGHREGHPQEPHRRGPASPGRGGAQRGRLHLPFGSGELEMQEAARVYAEALFEVAKEKGKLDPIRDQLTQFADALDANRELRVFFFSPYFSSAEKADGLKRAIAGAEPEFVNFLELLIEKHRIAEVSRVRRHFEELG